MKTYARIQSGGIAEIVTTNEDIRTLFHPALYWEEITVDSAHIGWRQTESGFVEPPPLPAVPAVQAPATLAQLHAELDTIMAEIARLSHPA